MISFLIFFLLILLLLTGTPVSIALGLTVIAAFYAFTDVPLDTIALKLFTGMEKFEIMAVPFFILAGCFLTHGGVAKRMIRFAVGITGNISGGLGLASVIACAIFASISGSSAATVIAVGSILIPAMTAQGYPLKFSSGVIASSGTLGILIPPSIVMVLYSLATSGISAKGPSGETISAASVDDLFVAGIIPGLLLAILLAVVTWWIAIRNGLKKEEKTNWKETIKNFKECFWGLALIIVVLGGIYGGLVTPTEAAALSAVYAFIVAKYVYRDLRWKEVPQVLLSAANMSSMLLYIISNATLFSFLLTYEHIPQSIAGWIVEQGFGQISFLLIVNILLLLAGMILEPSSIILIMAPILFPVAANLGVDPVHFGIILVVNMEIGMITPPVGLNLYMTSGVTKLGLTETAHSVMPWLTVMLFFLVLVSYWPDLSLTLPRMLGLM